MEIKKKVCPKCGKVIKSIYDKQLEYNFNAHLLSCKVGDIDETQN